MAKATIDNRSDYRESEDETQILMIGRDYRESKNCRMIRNERPLKGTRARAHRLSRLAYYVIAVTNTTTRNERASLVLRYMASCESRVDACMYVIDFPMFRSKDFAIFDLKVRSYTKSHPFSQSPWSGRESRSKNNDFDAFPRF